MRPTRAAVRWAVPFGVAASVLAVGALAGIAAAGPGSPSLPALSPAELIAKTRSAHVPFSGTVALTSNLGLPSTASLGGFGVGAFPAATDLLAGTHTARVWVQDAEHFRLATAKPLSETNWIRNGNDLWSYDSATNHVTHVTLAAKPDAADNEPAMTEPTPPDAARAFLQHLPPGTDLRVTTSSVAGRDAYDLVVSPSSASSTIAEVVVSIDSTTGLPLRVRVDARSTSSPAIDLRFTDVAVGAPDASIFQFTPPPGATVARGASAGAVMQPAATRHDGDAVEGVNGRSIRQAPAAATAPVPGESKTIGTGWDTVMVLPAGSVPPQVTAIVAHAPRVSVGAVHGRVVTTSLVTAILLDDGRVAVGALTPRAVAAALSTAG